MSGQFLLSAALYCLFFFICQSCCLGVSCWVTFMLCKNVELKIKLILWFCYCGKINKTTTTAIISYWFKHWPDSGSATLLPSSSFTVTLFSSEAAVTASVLYLDTLVHLYLWILSVKIITTSKQMYLIKRTLRAHKNNSWQKSCKTGRDKDRSVCICWWHIREQ